MAKLQQDLTWINANVDSLPAEAKALHAKVREAFEITKAAKQAFESNIIASMAKLDPAKVDASIRDLVTGLKAGKTLKFSYMRGLAVAVADKSKPSTSAAKGISLG